MYDIVNICSHYMCLVGMGLARCFVMRSLKMQLRLFKYVLADWLGHAFCMARIIFGKDMVPKDQYCSLSSVPRIKCKTSCIARKGEKQIQILDGY
jgi:hypothetical protein